MGRFRTSAGSKSTLPAALYRDGPLSIRPPEDIAFGTGRCALGALLVATGDRGIVTIMVRSRAAELLRDLPPRFQKANLIRDETGCKALVAGVAAYIAAPFGPFPLRLDLRGTAFQCSVWNAVRRIPCGGTATYARIAAAIGAPKAVRAVASSCTRCWFAFAVPCHRVVSSAGANPEGEGARRYRWLAYEAGLLAKRATSKSRL